MGKLDLKSPDLIFFILFLFCITGNPLLNIETALAAGPLSPTSINITKFVSSENLSKSASIVILLKITKQGSTPVKEVTVTDLVPPMLAGEPKELFKDS